MSQTDEAKDAVRHDTVAHPMSAVFSMTLCVAMLIASEFMPVSLLTPMAEGLGATAGQTGQAVSVSGLFAVAASLLTATVAGRIDRKIVLLVMTTLMLVSLVMVALAPNFAVLMTARALLGITIGGFWSLATAVLMRLVAPAKVPQALAIMYTGQALAAAFAAPIGSYLGGLIGWRGVFWVLVPLVVINLFWQAIALPALPARSRLTFSNLLGVLFRPYFLRALGAIVFTWGSAFTMFTYLRPFLEGVTGVGVTTLSILLLVLGCAGFIGTWLAGRLAGDHVGRLLVAPPLVMGAVTLGLLAFGHSLVLVAVLLAVWGAMNTAVSIIWMAWLSQNVDDAPEAAGSLMVAAIQASILLGALIGGLLLDAFGIGATFAGSIVMALAAILFVGSGRSLLKH
ncbi:MFS transporter [Martelella radicis]|uniref:Putative MFS family arabinose efflux permease n=1 Tax=Martelella radicis TaxID=1397476 RepID=A0A7W6KK13_9HYPH|nr:MFS transporter [Martelella radicis]MBB4122721.1 putative MFS family arabinose efflux permease [Martelella radicis]